MANFGYPDCDLPAESPEAVSAVLQSLARYERRLLLHVLRSRGDEPVPIEGLVESAVELGQPGSSLDPESLLVQCRHAHLPRLDDLGIVDYEPDRGIVRYRSNEVLERVLDLIEDGDVWSSRRNV